MDREERDPDEDLLEELVRRRYLDRSELDFFLGFEVGLVIVLSCEYMQFL